MSLFWQRISWMVYKTHLTKKYHTLEKTFYVGINYSLPIPLPLSRNPFNWLYVENLNLKSDAKKENRKRGERKNSSTSPAVNWTKLQITSGGGKWWENKLPIENHAVFALRRNRGPAINSIYFVLSWKQLFWEYVLGQVHTKLNQMRKRMLFWRH